jgi:hypothetical protein
VAPAIKQRRLSRIEYRYSSLSLKNGLIIAFAGSSIKIFLESGHFLARRF